MFRSFFKLIALAAVIGFGSCSSTNVLYTDYDKDVDLGKYKTFKFYETTVEKQTEWEPRMENLDKLKAAIRREMEARNYRYAESNPDLLVNIGIVFTREVQTRETDLRTDGLNYVGQRNYTWQSQEVVVREWDAGTLSIDLVDARENELRWQGVVKDAVTKNQKKAEERINAAVTEVFKKFPARSK